MPRYSCMRCGYDSINKADMKRHLSRKKPCDCILSNVDIQSCLKSIDKKTIKIETILDKKEGNESSEFKNEINLLKNEISEIKNEISELRNKIEKINSSDTQPEKVESVKTKLKFVNYLTIDYQESEELVKFVNKMKIRKESDVEMCILNLFTHIHCNDMFPEYRIIKIENLREKRIIVFDGEKSIIRYKGNFGVWKFIKEFISNCIKDEILNEKSNDNFEFLIRENLDIEIDSENDIKDCSPKVLELIDNFANMLYNNRTKYLNAFN